MSELSANHLAEIVTMHGSAEFGRFQQALVEVAQEFNEYASGGQRFDVSGVEPGRQSGAIFYGDCTFEFALDQGDDARKRADIVYRFRTGAAQAGPAVGGNGNGNGNGNGHAHQASTADEHELPGDPRNTPWMRYQPEIIGCGTEPGQFAFYWDGEATEELAESLLREFIDWTV